MNDLTVANAKMLCRQQHSGVLSTHSKKLAGYPLGSIVPFYLTPKGEPVIYISTIAQHTANIKQNPKVSLTIFDASAPDSQAAGRVCLLGNAVKCDDHAVAEQYWRFFPDAIAYQKTHDFSFYRIEVVSVRYIGGFGDINWITDDRWRSSEPDWQPQAQSMIDHMNDDHQEAMQLILRDQHNVYAPHVTMLSVYPEGCHFRAAQIIYFIAFDVPCLTALAVRQALVSLTNAAREQLVD